MFCYGALPVLVRAAEKRGAIDRRIRPALAVLGGIVLSVVMIWFPLSAWFSGVTYLPLFLTFQTLLLVGVPQIATGMLAARIGRSLRVGTVSGAVSLLFISAIFLTPECRGCDRSLLLLLAPLWAGFALVGSVTELGLPSRLRLPKVSGRLGTIRIDDVQRVGLALVLSVCLWTLVAHNLWDASALFAISSSYSHDDTTLS